jgi:hypothetical protein
VEELLFIESGLFQKWVRKNRLQSAITRLRADLVGNRLLGDVIPGSGGLRKVRMAGGGRGKQGGFRVVYVLLVNRQVAALLRGYAKSDQEDLTAEELARAVAEVAVIRPIAEALVLGQAQNQPEE